MEYTSVINPRWTNPEHTAIDCEVNFLSVPEESVTFTSVPAGDYPHSHKIYSECISGKYGLVAEYTPPAE